MRSVARRRQGARGAAQACAAGLVVWLGGCAAPPPASAPVDAPPPAPSVQAAADPELQRWEDQQRDRAAKAEAQGRWAEAVTVWQSLALLRPDDSATAARLNAARQRVDALAAERMAAAATALRRGDVDAASLAYLDALALDPGRKPAADALRQIERERNRRSQVGRFARSPVTTAAATPAPRRAADPEYAAAENSEASRSAQNLLEHATLLARQGDVDSAIQLLRDAPQTRSDAALRAQLADLYVQKGEALRPRQPDAARSAAEAALALDPRHAAARALLQSLPPRPRARTAP